MKILVNGYYNFLPKNAQSFSGPRNLLGNLVDFLDSSKHDYTAVVLMGKKIDDGKYTVKRIKTKKQSSWLVIKLRLNTKNIYEAKSPTVPQSVRQPIETLTKLLSKEKPDIFFLNGMSVSNWYLLQVARNLNIPVITNHLGLWYKEVPEYGATKNAIKLMNEMERDMVRYSAKNIFLSKLSYEHFNKQLIKVPKTQAVFIHNPIDPVFYKNSNTKLPGKNLIKVGVVARWDPIKNHRDLLKTVMESKKQSLPLEFHAVTTIHKNYPWSKDIKDDYSKNVVIHGPMKPKELSQFYRKMDILILPSHFDVSPTVVMEGIMQNRMTIVSPNVGLASVYKDQGASEYIVNFSNPRIVLKKIMQLAHKTPSGKLKKYIAKHYHPKFVMESYIKLFKQVLQS